VLPRHKAARVACDGKPVELSPDQVSRLRCLTGQMGPFDRHSLELHDRDGSVKAIRAAYLLGLYRRNPGLTTGTQRGYW